MAKEIGGRGKRASYETTHVRIPVPIKDKVEFLKHLYFEDELSKYERDLAEDKRLADEYRNLLTGNISYDMLNKLTQILNSKGMHISESTATDTLNNQFQTSLKFALHICKQILKKRKSAKISLINLLTALYGVEVKEEDLN